jgi:hypothetical protein
MSPRGCLLEHHQHHHHMPNRRMAPLSRQRTVHCLPTSCARALPGSCGGVLRRGQGAAAVLTHPSHPLHTTSVSLRGEAPQRPLQLPAWGADNHPRLNPVDCGHGEGETRSVGPTPQYYSAHAAAASSSSSVTSLPSRIFRPGSRLSTCFRHSSSSPPSPTTPLYSGVLTAMRARAAGGFSHKPRPGETEAKQQPATAAGAGAGAGAGARTH